MAASPARRARPAPNKHVALSLPALRGWNKARGVKRADRIAKADAITERLNYLSMIGRKGAIQLEWVGVNSWQQTYWHMRSGRRGEALSISCF